MRPLSPTCRRVLARLLEGPATNVDLLHPAIGGNRFGARLLEIREAGVSVSCERITAGRSLYTLADDSVPHARGLLARVAA